MNTQLDQEKNTKYSWGNEGIEENQFKANSWNGNFPSLNTNKDKFYYSAPVGSFSQTITAFMILQEMYGNGAQIGIIQIITQ